MIKFIQENEQDLADVSVNRIEIIKEEAGHIDEYVLAFTSFLTACGFVSGTIKKAIPSYEV